MKRIPALWDVIRREVTLLTGRPIYLAGILLVPILMAAFFASLLSEGLPVKVPAAVVDLDHSQLSQTVTRNLGACEMVDVKMKAESFNEAMDAVQSGKVMGFFIIPRNFEEDATAGNGPTLSFYSNLTYYVPGTLVFKGFKTLAVTTSGAVVQTNLVSRGASDRLAGTFLQPMTVTAHPLNNPWLNYAYYLGTSFLPGVLELMIFLMTVFAIGQEIKTGSSRRWLETARGDIWLAIMGKLAPQTLLFTVIGFGMNSLMFRWLHYPMNGSMANLLLGMFLFVIACQSFAVFVCSVMPNMRLSLSICSLLGILAFSVAAFSFPVEAMYGAIGIFSYILPVRWYFLIYIDQALNGIPLYYSREFYAALLMFVIPAVLCAPLLRRTARNPIYVP